MPTHILRAAVLAAAFLPSLPWAAPLTLESALELAVQRSGATRSARAALASAAEMARAAGQLPDPMLRAGVENLPVTGGDRFSTTRDSMTMKRVGVSQEWLGRDKRAARQAAADAAVGKETVAAQAAAAQVRLQTAMAYADAFYIGRALELSTLIEHHAHEEFEAARARLASSAASSQEVLALEGARGVAADDSAEVRQQQNAANVALQRWVGIAPDELAPLAIPAAPAEEAYLAAHPSVLSMRNEAELARQTAAVTATNRKPNWTWEVSYGQRSGYSDMLSFGVSIPLPVAAAQRQDRETAAKLALVDKAEADLAEAGREARTEYRSLRGDVDRLLERTARYRSAVVIPAAQRTAAATAGYRSNQTSLVTLFEARHAEVEAQRKLLSLERDLARARAQLAFKPLDLGAAQ